MTTFYPNLKTLTEYRDYILLAKPIDKTDTIKNMEKHTNNANQQRLSKFPMTT